MLDIVFCLLFIVGAFFILFQCEFFRISFFYKEPLIYIVNVFFMTFSYFGLIVLYFELHPYRLRQGVDNQEVIFTILCYNLYSIVVFNGVFLFLKRAYMSQNRVDSISACLRPSMLAIYLAAFCGIISLCITVYQTENLPIFEFLNGNMENASELRLQSVSENFPFKRVLKTLRKDWLTVMMLISFCIYLQTRKLSFLTLIIVFFLMINSVMYSEKSQFAYVLLALLCVSYYCTKPNRIRILPLATVSLSIMIVLIMFYIKLMGNSNILGAIKSIFGRIFTAQILGSYFILEIFPEKLDYLIGGALPNPGGLTPFGGFNLDKYIQIHIRGLNESGSVGSSPTIYWGNLYANFGLIGLFIGPYLASTVVFIYYSLISLFRSAYVRIALVIYYSFDVKVLALGSLNNLLINVDYLMVILLSAIFFGVRRNSFFSQKQLNSANS